MSTFVSTFKPHLLADVVVDDVVDDDVHMSEYLRLSSLCVCDFQLCPIDLESVILKPN